MAIRHPKNWIYCTSIPTVSKARNDDHLSNFRQTHGRRKIAEFVPEDVQEAPYVMAKERDLLLIFPYPLHGREPRGKSNSESCWRSWKHIWSLSMASRFKNRMSRSCSMLYAVQ